MYLKNLLQKQEFNKIEKDCEKVEKGDVYFCLTSDEKKARERAEIAENNGAKAVVSQFDLNFPNSIKVGEPRVEFAKACADFYGNPADELTMIGITGTNGKTTTSHLIAQILQRIGVNTGVIGTNGVFYNGKRYECPLTTPDADFLHKNLRLMKNSGVEVVVMEVSAHAIEQKRVEGINFEIGVLTNITQDHLDYFKTQQNYENTKLSFFTPEHIRKAVVCTDDKSGCNLIEKCEVPTISYGIKNPSDVFALDTFCSMEGSHFVANVRDDVMRVRTNLVGEYNILNSLAALCVCQELGLKKEQLVKGLEFVLPIEGRFNVMKINGKYVVIDFAHSPDSMKNVLQTARQLTDKKVWVVFGCGGNRDKDKRHKMGATAEKYADFVCLTNDNPRLEFPQDIIEDIEEGMQKPHMVELDRKTAIKKVVDCASEGDIIIVAGKGAEKYQEIGRDKVPYNDFDAVYSIFKDSDPLKYRGKGW